MLLRRRATSSSMPTSVDVAIFSSLRERLQAKLSEAQEHGAGLQQKLDAAVAAQEKLAARLEQQRASAAAAADDLQARPALCVLRCISCPRALVNRACAPFGQGTCCSAVVHEVTALMCGAVCGAGAPRRERGGEQRARTARGAARGARGGGGSRRGAAARRAGQQQRAGACRSSHAAHTPLRELLADVGALGHQVGRIRSCNDTALIASGQWCRHGRASTAS